MKLLIFAHIPPPHHGQSYMVQLMLAGFGGDHRRPPSSGSPPAESPGIDCYHVNARVSKTLEDIGDFRFGKFLKLLGYCLQAIWCRFRYGVKNLYYIPAPGKRSALYRDWVVMLLCRPFFKRVILHWHAAGLAKWLETDTSIRIRSLTYRLMKRVDLSIVLSDFNRRDAEKLKAARLAVVNVGVPDPCPDFEQDLLPRRSARGADLSRLLASGRRETNVAPEIVRVLFLAHCTREKGMFEAVEGVALANAKLEAEHSPIRFHLTLIGAFVSAREEKELYELLQRHSLQKDVECLGFVPAERKAIALREADLFCFPTHYSAENQPGNLIEAMAYGLPMVTTRWRSIPEMLPENYPGLVDPQSAVQVADALRRMVGCDLAGPLRAMFVRRFTLQHYLHGMADAIRSVEPAGAAPTEKAA